MDSSKLVIIGANGQLGKALQNHYPAARSASSSDLDITNAESVDAYNWSDTEVIINAAAFTNVDGAETKEGRTAAWAVNAAALKNLARAANASNITLVHISSDYVFDGTKEIHTEDEALSPLSVYGASKAAGDLVTSLLEKHYILRTSWVIGDGSNFVRTMASLAERNISPTVVHDQIGRLTFTKELVRAIDHLLANRAPYGTYNVSNSGESVSWADITRVIFQELNRADLTVSNTTTAEYFAGKEGIAPRPLQSTLSLEKIQATGFTSLDWKSELSQYLKDEQ